MGEILSWLELVTRDAAVLAALKANDQVAFEYVDAAGNPTMEEPANPNGSMAAIAGICDATGRVLGTARCRRLQVEDGGQITGRIEMLTETARQADGRMESLAD